ncbi:MAG: alpha/beta hydrolase [Syntrophaceae bacterium]
MVSPFKKTLIISLVVIIFIFLPCFSLQSTETTSNYSKPSKSQEQSKPVIIMIHGMFAGGWVWENYRRYFEEKGYRCITPTLRYHDTLLTGQPPSQLGSTSILDYVSDMEKEIKKLDSPPIVIGHSMGGLIAQIIGSRGMAKSLVLLSPAAPWGINPVTVSVVKSAWMNKSRFVFWNEPVQPTFDGTVYSTLHLMSPEDQSKIYQKFTYESGQALWEIGLWPFDLNRASKVDESKVTCPVLVISGSEDRITPSKIGWKIADKYNAAFRKYVHHAHWIIGEPGWEIIAKDIYEWLQLKK